MKKIAILAAAVFCSPLAMAQAPAEEVVVADSAQAINIIDKLLQKMDEIATVLESVTDTASAEVAATKITQIKADLDALSEEMEALGELPLETQQELENKLMEGVMMIAPRLEAAGSNLSDNDFYNCPALIQAISQE